MHLSEVTKARAQQRAAVTVKQEETLLQPAWRLPGFRRELARRHREDPEKIFITKTRADADQCWTRRMFTRGTRRPRTDWVWTIVE